MKRWRDFFRQKKEKMGKKETYLVLFLLGILLLVVVIPIDSGQKQGEPENTAAMAQQSDPETDYVSRMEKRLKQTLSRMEGVGKVEVMIVCQDSGESIVEKDVDYHREEQADSNDAATVSREDHEEEAVYSSRSGDGEPYVSRQLVPRIQGVLVLAQGADHQQVVTDISEAVQALFGLEPHKIKVVKMNLQEDSQ